MFSQIHTDLDDVVDVVKILRSISIGNTQICHTKLNFSVADELRRSRTSVHEDGYGEKREKRKN